MNGYTMVQQFGVQDYMYVADDAREQMMEIGISAINDVEDALRRFRILETTGKVIIDDEARTHLKYAYTVMEHSLNEGRIPSIEEDDKRSLEQVLSENSNPKVAIIANNITDQGMRRKAQAHVAWLTYKANK